MFPENDPMRDELSNGGLHVVIPPQKLCKGSRKGSARERDQGVRMVSKRGFRREVLRGLRRVEIKSCRSKELIRLSLSILFLLYHLFSLTVSFCSSLFPFSRTPEKRKWKCAQPSSIIGGDITISIMKIVKIKINRSSGIFFL